MTSTCKDLIQAINTAIAPIMAKHNLCWGSLQINVNSVSEKHTDANNSGMSLLLQLGKFTGGAYRCVDSRFDLSDVRV